MPKGKTGNPRGRPRGTNDEQALSEEAIYYALVHAFQVGIIPFGGKPELRENRATKLAKLLADPRSQVTFEEVQGWSQLGFQAFDRFGENQFADDVRDTVQRRNGTKGQDHYLEGEAGLYVREAAGYVEQILTARSPQEAFQIAMTLRSRWHPAVTTRLYWLSLGLQAARNLAAADTQPGGN